MSLKQLLTEAENDFRKHLKWYEIMRDRHGDTDNRVLLSKVDLIVATNRVKLLKQKIAQTKESK